MRETRGAKAYHKRLERKLEPVQDKPRQRRWSTETAVNIGANLAVWITGSGIIGQMLDSKNAGGVISLGVSVIIAAIVAVMVIERRTK